MIDNQLVQYLKQGCILVTPNNRLSKQLIADFYASQDQVVIDAPNCMPYTSLLHYLFALLPGTNHPLLLSNIQQRYLWKKILQQSANYSLGLLDAVQTAWINCQNFSLEIAANSFAVTTQTQQFQQWADAFMQQVLAYDAITDAQLVDYILDLFAASLKRSLLSYAMTNKISGIVWVCFADFTPAQLKLQHALNANDIMQYVYNHAVKSEITAMQYAATDVTAEHLHWINWAKTQINNGYTRIGIVVPELQSQAQALKRVLADHFTAEQINLSLGQALSDYPMVAHALVGLQLNCKMITRKQSHILLHSPYIHAHQIEYLARADLSAKNDTINELFLSWKYFLHVIQEDIPHLYNCLSNLTAYPEQASLLEWVDIFKLRLHELGFPGGMVHDSAQYQCFQRFILLFDDFLQLALITPMLSQQAAIAEFIDLAAHTIFQPQEDPTAPIHILGLLEAAGCTFQQIWVTGLTDECLPQKTQFSSFIPIALQREYKMPRTCVHKELLLAQQLIATFQASSMHSIYSYPQWHGDLSQLPSPLLVNLPKFIPDNLNCLSFMSSALMAWEDAEILSLNVQNTRKITTNLLAYQAQCPFRAFAAYRLNAQPIELAVDGLSLRERGIILHNIMEVLWKNLGDQATLLNYTAIDLDILINQVIVKILKKYAKLKPYSFSVHIQKVEQERLYNLVMACLNWDKCRPEFVIDALEKTYVLEFNSMTMQVRIDRIDRILATNSKLLIDYKSNMPNILPWNDSRLESPQLPLYTLIDNTIQTILFMQLKTDNVIACGITAEDIQGVQTPRNQKTLTEYKIQWQTQLNALVTEFQNGHISPMPSREVICNGCEFHRLCRV